MDLQVVNNMEIVYLALLSATIAFHYSNREWLNKTMPNQFLKDHINGIVRTLLVLTLLVVAPTYTKLTILGLITGILGGYQGKKSYEKYQKMCDIANLERQSKEQNFVFKDD